MKNLLTNICFVVIALSSVILVSCGDDDNDNSKNKSTIVGTWESETLPFYNDLNVLSTTSTFVTYLWFKENGTFVEADVITDRERNHTYTELSEKGKWSVKGDSITWSANFDLYDDPDASYTETCKFRVSGNMLQLSAMRNGEEKSMRLQRTTVEKMQEIISTAKQRNQ